MLLVWTTSQSWHNVTIIIFCNLVLIWVWTDINVPSYFTYLALLGWKQIDLQQRKNMFLKGKIFARNLCLPNTQNKEKLYCKWKWHYNLYYLVCMYASKVVNTNKEWQNDRLEEGGVPFPLRQSSKSSGSLLCSLHVGINQAERENYYIWGWVEVNRRR